MWFNFVLNSLSPHTFNLMRQRNRKAEEDKFLDRPHFYRGSPHRAPFPRHWPWRKRRWRIRWHNRRRGRGWRCGGFRKRATYVHAKSPGWCHLGGQKGIILGHTKDNLGEKWYNLWAKKGKILGEKLLAEIGLLESMGVSTYCGFYGGTNGKHHSSHEKL